MFGKKKKKNKKLIKKNPKQSKEVEKLLGRDKLLSDVTTGTLG